MDLYSDSESEQNRPPVSRYTLSFRQPELDTDFGRYTTVRSLLFVRYSLLLAIVLYIVFAFLDPLIMPEMVWEISLIRIISILFFCGAIWFTFTDLVFENLQALMSVVVLFASLGIILMILLSEFTGGYLYYAALILAIIYAHNLLRLRFIYASITTWIVIAVYAIATVWLNVTPFYIFLNNMFFLISANILGMSASYWIEYYMKAVFWKERSLQEKTRQLEKEYLRKSVELDAAREIQLSMLPQQNPEMDGYQFAYSMNPASEVGGDYYDFLMCDGQLTFGIGDATGHGMQAGVMVTAMKLLFSERASGSDLIDFLAAASASIRLMGCKKIFLAFAIGRLRENQIEFAGAGMPAALVRRHSTGCVEQIPLKGMPLGSSLHFPYRKNCIQVNPGDTILLMTDGFPELSNDSGEMIGYDRTAELISKMGQSTPDELIRQLNDFACDWIGNSLQNDDLTFFAIKRALSPGANQIKPERS